MIHHANHVIAWAPRLSPAHVSHSRRGWPERLGFLFIAVNWIATPFVEDRRSWLELQFGVLAVNATLVVALGGLSSLTNRTWPLAAAGLELVGVLVRAVPAINSQAFMRAAPYADNVIGYLVLGCAVGGAVVEANKDSSHASLRSR